MINRALSLFLINYFSNGGKGEHRGRRFKACRVIFRIIRYTRSISLPYLINH
jgi:hypothetical protein